MDNVTSTPSAYAAIAQLAGSQSSGSDVYDAVSQLAAPSDVTSAQSDTGDTNYNNLCEKFVEQQVYGRTGIFPSAIDAWNNYSQSGKAISGTDGMQPGDQVFFSPNRGNGNYGHVGLFSGYDPQGNPQFISATEDGVQTKNIQDWQQQTGQQILGYVPHGGQQ